MPPEIQTPALIVDLDRAQANIDAMARLAEAGGTRLRPHIKSHKMPYLAGLQLAAGASGLTCATLDEAEVMADAGCADILLAYPVWGAHNLARLRRLRERVRLRVSLDSAEVAAGVGAMAGREPVEVLVEVDSGLGRLGRPPGRRSAELVADIDRVPGVTVVGLCSHAGHSYRARSTAELREIAEREVAELAETVRLCGGDLEISLGATPTARWEAAAAEVAEIRPGTYALNDTTMAGLGVATHDTCAARVLATVVATPVPGRFVVDAGTKALAADGAPGTIGVVGRPGLRLDMLYEEHGVGHGPETGGPAIGDRIELIPNHVCPVSNLFDLAFGVRGGRVERELEITAKRRSVRCAD
ncbi:hypothetical protein D0T12_30055 [Actinomadura spongiicola]|uniref:D-serine dehydratase-like domain-containing protein n=1 Tax=Actinomadura spongiicola TaxID=2303421 RepID=A0A372G993_9ACTN|nr:alanine racemase [Actinomadura spongiicola]RFS81950.1 hypothetical protein D0T12_30055 [Actinomadura spongiicola]